MISTITSVEAKTRFGELLDRVAAGEEIVITRHDKAVARMIPEGRPGTTKVAQAVAGLRNLRQQIGARQGFKPISDKEIVSAIHEGRR